MALRNNLLDDRITAAAMEEFQEKGYMKASLRKIAEKAGVTVGAIQTRYSSKDELFASLLRQFLDGIEEAFRDIRSDYYSGADRDIREQLGSSMRYESKTILRLIFDHYEEAVLLMYRSAGSSLEHYFDELVKRKVEQSVLFFRNAGQGGVDERLLGLLISAQFDSFRRIVSECPDPRTAESYMSTMMTYHLGGWTALFDSLKSAQEVSDEV